MKESSITLPGVIDVAPRDNVVFRSAKERPFAERKATLVADYDRPGDNNRPTICHVLHSLNVGGAEILASRLAEQMNDRFQFVFVCLDELGAMGQQFQDKGFAIEVLNRKPGFDWHCARQLSSIWKKHNVAVVHAHQYTPFFYSLAGGLLGRRPQVLFTEHGRFFPDHASWKRSLFNRTFLRRSDRIVGVGGAVKQALIDNEGIPARRIDVIFNGVDTNAFATDRVARTDIREKLDLSEDDFVIVQIARLDPIKDHTTALQTVERLVSRNSHIRFVIVGDGPERQRIEKEIEDRELQSCVRMLGSRSDIPELLSASDAFLLTSVSEGIPVTLIEAMLVGVPVVSTEVGGVPEIIKDGESGLLAKAKDDEALADAIERCVEDAGLRKSIAEAGRARAIDMFSEQRMHNEYQAVYEEMLGERLS